MSADQQMPPQGYGQAAAAVMNNFCGHPTPSPGGDSGVMSPLTPASGFASSSSVTSPEHMYTGSPASSSSHQHHHPPFASHPSPADSGCCFNSMNNAAMTSPPQQQQCEEQQQRLCYDPNCTVNNCGGNSGDVNIWAQQMQMLNVSQMLVARESKFKSTKEGRKPPFDKWPRYGLLNAVLPCARACA